MERLAKAFFSQTGRRRSNLVWATRFFSSKHPSNNKNENQFRITRGAVMGTSALLLVGFSSALLVDSSNHPSNNKNDLGFLSALLAEWRRIRTTCRVETIPYSRRTHLLLSIISLEESLVRTLTDEESVKVLPPTHPTAAKVALITQNVSNALQRDLTHNDMDKVASVWGGRWKALWQGPRYIDWKVVLIDSPQFEAWATLDGTIVMYTGLVEHFNSDAEIATVISHEVGHILARHGGESITKCMLTHLFLPLLYMYNLAAPDVHKIPVDYLGYLNRTSAAGASLSRKQELEADYIGLLLMASAGYDPRVALTALEKAAQLEGGHDASSRILGHPLSPHPTKKTRIQCLEQALEEAMVYYNQSLSSLDVSSDNPNT